MRPGWFAAGFFAAVAAVAAVALGVRQWLARLLDG